MRIFYRDGKKYVETTFEELGLDDPYLGLSKEEYEQLVAEMDDEDQCCELEQTRLGATG